MKFSRIVLVPAALLLILVAVPFAGASTNVSGPSSSCGQLGSCYFVLNTSAGIGYASTSVFGSISFRLPGETNGSTGTFGWKVVGQTGTVDRVQGTIFATDSNSGKIVLGSTDTNITVTKHCYHTGCSYTYSMVNGTVKLHLTSLDATTTAVSCSPSTFAAGSSTKCTATVTDGANHSLTPTGTVTFSTYYGVGVIGSFAHHGACSLVSGSCILRFTALDETVGSFQILVSYHGFHPDYKSAGSTTISVTGN